MNQEITKLLENSLIEKSKSDYIIEKFSDFTKVANEWNEKANAILVTDESQKDLMLQAREGRLLLKAKRIEIEKTRKSLKEQSLNEGRLIDGIAKTLTALVEPAEKHLELQERYAEIQDQKRKAELKAKRYELILPYAEVIDPEALNLDLITEEAFLGIMKFAKHTLEAKVESDRIAKEEKESLVKADELEAKKNAELKAISDKMKEQEIVIEKIVEKEVTQKDEMQILKEKYAIAKTSLEAVLWYIVPDDCRKMVCKALEELKNKNT